MNFSKTGKVFMVLAIVAVFAIAATSFAGWGRGYGGDGYHMGPGYGMHRGGAEGPRGYGGQGYQSDLSDEDIAKLDKERQAFFEATSDSREKFKRNLNCAVSWPSRNRMLKKPPGYSRKFPILKASWIKNASIIASK